MTKKVDWESIELDFRAGLKTLRVIADEHGLSHVAVTKRAKRDGWARDLSVRIRAKTEYLVNKRLVNEKVTKERLVTEKQLIDAAAETQTTIVVTHRKDIQRSRAIGTKLFLELEAQTDNNELYGQLGELMAKPNVNFDKLNEIYKKTIAMPGRVDSFKKLTDSLKNTIGMERQAFGLADNANGDADAPKERMVFDLHDYNL